MFSKISLTLEYICKLETETQQCSNCWR